MKQLKGDTSRLTLNICRELNKGVVLSGYLIV